jgi:hypothetical protein
MERFPLGDVVITANARDQLDPRDTDRALTRHRACDWGDVGAADAKLNDLALRDGLRLFSVYHAADGTKFWVITEADRSATTILLPEDY